MSSIEEKLWNYIDGSCTPDEQQAIGLLIEQDEAYRDKYMQLLTLDREFSAMELDEPPMALTFNVMEVIRAEHAQKPLTATINKSVIRIISMFFVLIIAAMLIILIANINWSARDSGLQLPAMKLPDLKNYLNGPILKGFLFFDMILGLFLFDTYLRNRGFLKQS